jgi:hypothetical protein
MAVAVPKTQRSIQAVTDRDRTGHPAPMVGKKAGPASILVELEAERDREVH